jgi:hypothetical protein
MVAQVWVRWCTRLQPLPRLTERSLGCSLTPRAVSGHGQRAADELRDRHPRVMLVHIPVHASWLNQIEIYFSIIQRKVLTPNDCTTLDELAARIHAFGQRYSALDKPFAWRFTRQDLEQRLKHPDLQLQPLARLPTAA